jgi:hypothetical protein
MWTKVRMKVDHSTYLKKFCGQQFHAYINQKQSPVGTTCKRQDKWDPSTAMRTSVHYRQLFEPQSCTCFGPDIPVDNRAPHTDSVHAECVGVMSTPFPYFPNSVQTRFRSNRSGPAVYAASRNPSPPAVVPHGPYLFIPIWWRCAAP